MAHTVAEIKVCDCCGIATANADTSGCEFNCPDQHSERLCEFGLEAGENVVIDEAHDSIESFRCAGCGDDVMGGFAAVILAD